MPVYTLQVHVVLQPSLATTKGLSRNLIRQWGDGHFWFITKSDLTTSFSMFYTEGSDTKGYDHDYMKASYMRQSCQEDISGI